MMSQRADSIDVWLPWCDPRQPQSEGASRLEKERARAVQQAEEAWAAAQAAERRAAEVQATADTDRRRALAAEAELLQVHRRAAGAEEALATVAVAAEQAELEMAAMCRRAELAEATCARLTANATTEGELRALFDMLQAKDAEIAELQGRAAGAERQLSLANQRLTVLGVVRPPP